MRARRLLVVAFVLVGLGLPALLEADGGGPGPTQIDSPPPPRDIKYPRLDSQLNQMVERLGEVGAAEIAKAAPLSLGNGVAVTVRIPDGAADAVAAYLQAGGATVANVGVDYVEAYVPISLLAPLSEHDSVLWVQTIVPPQPLVTSEGAVAHNAPVWNARGFTGAGVQVGVIDVGFQGITALLGTELPATVVARCYTAVGTFTSDVSDCDTDSVHGTAVAEAVVDVAPSVSLYVTNPMSFGDLQSSAAWMTSQGVKVINHSVGWLWDGPGDGTSSNSNSPVVTVGQAVAAGAFWANAAGNAALDNWFGAYQDNNGNGWLEFNTTESERNPVFIPAGTTLTAQSRWSDIWNGATTDLDLSLWVGATRVAFSGNTQSGVVGQDPFEFLVFTSASGGWYDLSVFHFSGPVPSWHQLNSFSQQDLTYSVSATSIGNPAESANPGMLAVGAAKWSTPSTIESFSSQGPTTDGRVKPDIVGADGGNSVSYGAGGFFGTARLRPMWPDWRHWCWSSSRSSHRPTWPPTSRPTRSRGGPCPITPGATDSPSSRRFRRVRRRR